MLRSIAGEIDMTAQEIVRANRDAKVGREARPLVGGSNRGGIEAPSKPFFQAFPKVGCFAPSFSKESLGGFVGFQGVTRLPNAT
jgi:hypothetical protein